MVPLIRRLSQRLSRLYRRMFHQASAARVPEKSVEVHDNHSGTAAWGESSVHVFFSRVSDEFGTFDVGLRSKLSELHNTSLKTPSDIEGYESGYATLDKLWDFVRNADAIIHLVGNELGYRAPELMADEFLQRKPELRSWLVEKNLPYQSWSYTQWEVFLGKFRQHQTGDKYPRLFICGHDANKLKNPLEQGRSAVVHSRPAAEHLKTLRSLNIHDNIRFCTDSDLLTNLMVSAFGALVHRSSQQSVITSSDLEPAIVASAPAKALSDWPQLTSSDYRGRWLKRPELDQLLERIKATDRSTTLLLGVPGTGKSALLSRIADQCREDGIATVPIKADYISEDVSTASELALELGLPEGTDLVTSVRRLATDRPVVVLLDQLDALARLAVQKTTRLRLLIDMIDVLSGLKNIHLVASCRTFEQQHDPILRLIEADIIELKLPPWEEVAEVLALFDLNPDSWNEDLREMLRIPQALSTFIDLIGEAGDLSVMSSYQRMLDRLWEVRILSDSSGRRSQLVLNVATMLTDREALWLPLALFDQERTEIDQLIAADILRIEGAKVGFRHQTLLRACQGTNGSSRF